MSPGPIEQPARGQTSDYTNFMILRMIAATSVIFSHSFLMVDGHEEREPFVQLLGPQNIAGIYGVFVFFFISGFLVTRSAMHSRSVAGFVWKRILRVYPALFACAIVTGSVLGSLFTQLPLTKFWRWRIPFEYALTMPLDPNGWGLEMHTVVFD